ncbi:MAG: hypothetical protein AB7D35_11470 [Bacteroidales bacterium]
MRSLSLIFLFLVCLMPQIFAQNPHGEELKIACSDCHNSEGWKLILGTYPFDHVSTGFVLDGQHAQTDCQSCHPTLVFNEAEPSCISCHTDIHQQTTSQECGDCHQTNSWIVNNITSIHQMSRFPLLGAHFTADCIDCHTSASTLNFEPLGVNCVDCHEQDYLQAKEPDHVAGNYSLDCIECHQFNAFSWSGTDINHDFFPLSKGHDIPDCSQCHTPGTYSGLSPDCVSCHLSDYQTSNNPNHSSLNFSENCNECHSTDPDWRPADYRQHDIFSFPIYSGEHNGEWNTCTDCHQTASDYAQFTCISCHEHNRTEMDDEHRGVGGYIYESGACLECHPLGNADDDSFNHNLSDFPLLGSHTNTDCEECHAEGYAGTPTNCDACHMDAYLESINPNHSALELETSCADCHDEQPGWQPASFPLHNDYYALAGAHNVIANDCVFCHDGDYNNTPNTCYACHTEEYVQSQNPPHQSLQFSTECFECHDENAWTPSTFDHDGQFFPIYTGEHQGEWESCASCHTQPSNYALFSCIDCHDHNQPDMEEEHQGVPGYVYESEACFACHPTGNGDGGFNHNLTEFPLTGAHNTLLCAECHADGYVDTPMECFACHETAYNQSVNPSHEALALSTDCASCHTTEPDWQPATFAVHNDYYELSGAHAVVADACALCHQGDYLSTPNSCLECHQADYNQTINPNHEQLNIGTACDDCHTTEPEWQPATFPIHNDFYVLNGAHAAIANDCMLCHDGDYISTENTCYACHTDDYNQTTDPPHQSAQFPTDCQSCHTEISWEPSTFNHDALYFPIYSGEHQGEWNTCTDCHTNPTNYAIFSCTDCHEHNQIDMDDEHQGINGYVYESNACLECHPNGDSDKLMRWQNTKKSIR